MITLTIGQTLKVTATFEYSGPGFSGYKVRAALCQKGLTWEEILYKETAALSIPEPLPVLTLTTYTVPAGLLDILITPTYERLPGIHEPVSPGLYELYAKMIGIPGADLYYYGLLDDIEIIGAQVFQNLTVTYTKL